MCRIHLYDLGHGQFIERAIFTLKQDRCPPFSNITQKKQSYEYSNCLLKRGKNISKKTTTLLNLRSMLRGFIGYNEHNVKCARRSVYITVNIVILYRINLIHSQSEKDPLKESVAWHPKLFQTPGGKGWGLKLAYRQALYFETSSKLPHLSISPFIPGNGHFSVSCFLFRACPFSCFSQADLSRLFLIFVSVFPAPPTVLIS